jgi:hypothetical protein
LSAAAFRHISLIRHIEGHAITPLRHFRSRHDAAPFSLRHASRHRRYLLTLLLLIILRRQRRFRHALPCQLSPLIFASCCQLPRCQLPLSWLSFRHAAASRLFADSFRWLTRA